MSVCKWCLHVCASSCQKRVYQADTALSVSRGKILWMESSCELWGIFIHLLYLLLSLSSFFCSADVAFRLLSVRSLTVSLKLSQKLLIQFGVCYTYATKTALLYLCLTTVTSSKKGTDVHGLAWSLECQGCENKWPHC